MLKDIIEANASELLIPVAIFSLAIYATRGLFGLHGRRNQQRREFLEHWDPSRTQDNLWLEVTVRHLYGANLPAHVIRMALARSHSTQSLIELSELWPFFRYDIDTRTVCWRRKFHDRSSRRKISRYWPMIRYGLFALSGIFCAFLAYYMSGIGQWTYALLASLLIALAIASLVFEDTETILDEAGVDWIARINSAIEPVLQEGVSEGLTVNAGLPSSNVPNESATQAGPT